MCLAIGKKIYIFYTANGLNEIDAEKTLVISILLLETATFVTIFKKLS